jgi:conjugative relaxase-like TrwC/TraI family protein
MLRPQVQHSLRNAREYFREHLRVGDYYMEGRKIDGEWFGRGAENLGLAGKVEEKAFLALCDGSDPRTGRLLTLRLNSTRRENGRQMPNRRIFYDFTIGPPKSVSIVALCQDERIVELHNRAVRLAMAELEKFAETRVRMSGQNGERPTGNLVGVSFRHDTSRELDPHLHTHCVVMNATFDPVERRWKALQTQGMYRAQKFVENYYFHELCKGLRALGYEIENNARNFEIRHVPADVIARFSKRRRQIEEEARRRLARDGFRGPIEAIREQVAHDHRRRKIKDATAERLRPAWMSQMSAGERAALSRLAQSAPPPDGRADVASIVAWADQHVFERRSVVEDHELMSAALARGRGHAFDLADLTRAVEAGGYIREAGTRKLTSRTVLRCELDIVLAAADGRRQHAPLAPNHAPRPDLTGEQAVAVRQILGSRDFMTLFRGGAGTGKSYALKEVERGLTSAGRPVVVLAPQRQQVRDLEADGLPAQTLAQALAAKRLTSGPVVILDEAGQVGGRELRELIRLVQAHGGRLILSGDTRQHGAVSASDALLAIERYAGLKPAEIRRIRRQDPALGRSLAEKRFIREYRTAVKAAATGKIEESFDRLERLGCVREIATDDRRFALAAEYVAAVARKDRALVVAQTWDEVRAVNEAIREQLRDKGWIGMGSVLNASQPLDWGEAQKRDPRYYQPGCTAHFLRRYGRFAKGESCDILGANERGVLLMKDNRRSTLSYRYAGRIVVAAQAPMEIAPGDRLQLKFNGKSREGCAIANGELVTVRHVGAHGSLTVEDDAGVRKTLAPQQRLFTRGYAVTSYASQGKTVETVLFADSCSRAATNANQWYVAISRGRKRVIVFTSDKEALRANIRRDAGRDLALTLTPEGETAPAPYQRVPAWTRRAMAAIERSRLHRIAVRRALAARRTISHVHRP